MLGEAISTDQSKSFRSSCVLVVCNWQKDRPTMYSSNCRPNTRHSNTVVPLWCACRSSTWKHLHFSCYGLCKLVPEISEINIISSPPVEVWGKALESVLEAQFIPIQRIIQHCAYWRYKVQFARTKETVTSQDCFSGKANWRWNYEKSSGLALGIWEQSYCLFVIVCDYFLKYDTFSKLYLF